MHNDYFDEIIRRQLEEFDAKGKEDDWDSFEEKLENLDFKEIPAHNISLPLSEAFAQTTNSEESFPISDGEGLPHETQALDEAIKAKLSHYSAPLTPDAWTNFSEQLHGAFDSTLQAQLQQYQAQFQSTDWLEMQEKLNQPFDYIVKDKLKQYSVAFRAGDWRYFVSQLQAAQGIAPTPWYLRWQNQAAAAALALLLLSTLNFSRLERADRYLVVRHASSQLLEFSEDKKREGDEMRIGDELLADAGELDGTLIVQDEAENQAKRIVAINAERFEREAKEFEVEESIDESFAELPESFFVTPTYQQSQPPFDKKKSFKFPEIAKLNRIYEEPSLSVNALITDFEIPAASSREKIRPEVRVGFWGATLMSRAELNDSSISGFSTGLKAELRINKEWSIVSGILYSERGYSHKYYVYGGENAPPNWNLLDADIKLLEIPTLLKYEFPSKGPFSLYALAGISTMVTLEENYEHREQKGNDFIVRSLREIEPTDHKRNLNTYVGNLHFGAGLEYEVNPRLGMQIEPFFQLNMHDLGPEEKRLYTQGVAVSFMYLLGRGD